MKYKDFINWYESIVPLKLQEDFDNCGLQFGDLNKDITKILLSLDLDEKCISKAVIGGYDLIFTHHPPLFNPLKNIIKDSKSVTRRMITAIENDICVYSSHTNLDCVEFGVSYSLSKRIGLDNIENLQKVSENNGFGKIGFVEKCSAYDFLLDVKRKLSLDNMICYGNLDKIVSKIAVLGGSGGHFIEDCIRENCDVFISSEFKYNQQINAIDKDLILVDIGHYESEKFILHDLQNFISKNNRKLIVDINFLDEPTRKIL